MSHICEIYIKDVLVHGSTDNEYLDNTRKELVRLKEVPYVGHLILSTGTSFTEEKRLQVLDFLLPETEKDFCSSLD